MNLSKQELESILSRGNCKIRPEQKAILDQIKDEKTTKYHNKIVVISGIKFDSQAEANRWMEIELMVRVGILEKAERQVKYKLPGGITYVLDHLLTYPDGHKEAEEVKGAWTRTAINKVKQFVEIYRIPLYVVKNGRREPWGNTKINLKRKCLK